MKSLGKLFYLILFVLTAAILTCVILWTWMKIDAALYTMLALFAVYVAFLVFSLTHAKKTGKSLTEDEKLFSDYLMREEVKSVFLACYCKAEKLQNPNKNKRLFYAELYASDKLSEVQNLFAEEDNPLCMARFALSLSQLKQIRNKTVFINEELFSAIQNNELYKKLVNENNFLITDNH